MLEKKAFLRIDDADGVTGTFELRIGLEETTELDKSYLMAGRGQTINQVLNFDVSDFSVADDGIDDRRAGYWIDGGGGKETRTLTFKTGMENVQWGDGSGGTGPSNVTETDASGADVNPVSRKQVFEEWVRRTRTDSLGAQARLHWGEFTDGSFGSPGVYGAPVPVAIVSHNLESPDIDTETGSITGSVELARIATFPGLIDDLPDWIPDAFNTVQKQIGGIFD